MTYYEYDSYAYGEHKITQDMLRHSAKNKAAAQKAAARSSSSATSPPSFDFSSAPSTSGYSATTSSSTSAPISGGGGGYSATHPYARRSLSTSFFIYKTKQRLAVASIILTGILISNAYEAIEESLKKGAEKRQQAKIEKTISRSVNSQNKKPTSIIPPAKVQTITEPEVKKKTLTEMAASFDIEASDTPRDIAMITSRGTFISQGIGLERVIAAAQNECARLNGDASCKDTNLRSISKEFQGCLFYGDSLSKGITTKNHQEFEAVITECNNRTGLPCGDKKVICNYNPLK